MVDPDPDDHRANLLSDVERTNIDPVGMARRDLKRALPRRFYTQVNVGPLADGYGVFLDGKPVRTPAKAMFAVPTVSLAEALANEWQAQRELIEPDEMPLTRLCNSAIDGVANAIEPTIAEVAKYAETDLVCYRAGDPATLVAEQSAAWDPVLAFARQTLGASFICAEGVMYVAQPAPALAATHRAVKSVSVGSSGAFSLAALSVMTSLSGSVLLALAVADGAMTVEAAWSAAHVDEDYQARMWGADDEASQRKERRWRDMDAAAQVFRFVR